MTDGVTGFTVGIDEAHQHVTFLLGDRGIIFPPYAALRISADVLDASHHEHDGFCELAVAGLPRMAVHPDDARTIGRAIAAAADQLLVEAETPF